MFPLLTLSFNAVVALSVDEGNTYFEDGMIKLKISGNNIDSDMIDIYSIDQKGRKILWAVAHGDLIYDDRELYQRIKDDEVISFNLIEDD